MNAYTTDPEDVRYALMEAPSDDVETIGDACAALARIVHALPLRIGILEHEVQTLKEGLEAAVQDAGYAAYENGEDHL